MHNMPQKTSMATMSAMVRGRHGMMRIALLLLMQLFFFFAILPTTVIITGASFTTTSRQILLLMIAVAVPVVVASSSSTHPTITTGIFAIPVAIAIPIAVFWIRTSYLPIFPSAFDTLVTVLVQTGKIRP